MELTSKHPALSRDQISQAFSEAGAPLHPDLLEHLAAVNGAYLPNARVELPDGTATGGLSFPGLGQETDLLKTWQLLRSRLPAGSMPFARDAFGNYFIIRPEGTISFWDHDADEVTPIALSLAAFIDAIEEPTEDRASRPPQPAPDPERDIRRAVAEARIEELRDLLDAHPGLAATALVSAGNMGREAVVSALLEANIDVDARDAKGNTALMRATILGHLAVVKLLVAAGADLDASNTSGQTMQICALLSPDEEVKQILAEARK